MDSPPPNPGAGYPAPARPAQWAAQWAARLGTASLLFSAFLCLGVWLCYLLRPDWAAAVTLWPPWVWLAPGLLLVILGWGREWLRPARGLVALWLLFLLCLSEETRSLARLGNPENGTPLRVVSLNCAGGSEAAAGEVAAYRPDLVLLQEVPGQKEVRDLAERLFGPGAGVVWGVDTAILASRPLESFSTGPRVSHFVAGRGRLPGGREACLVSLRLTPPVVRFDLWAPDCWREQAENRRLRREQLREVTAEMATFPTEAAIILGGDFNAPAGDGVFRLLRPRLHDAFAEGGRGWANTALNDFPFSRIDQVWVSNHFRAASLTARRTVRSDHRIVVCDLLPR